MKRVFLSLTMIAASAIFSLAQAQDVLVSEKTAQKIAKIKLTASKAEEDADFKLARDLEKIELQAKAETEQAALKAKRKAEEDTVKGSEKARKKAEKASYKAREKAETNKIKAKLKAEQEINSHKLAEGGVL